MSKDVCAGFLCVYLFTFLPRGWGLFRPILSWGRRVSRERGRLACGSCPRSSNTHILLRLGWADTLSMCSPGIVRWPSSPFQSRRGRRGAIHRPMEANSHVLFSTPALPDEQVWLGRVPQGPACWGGRAGLDLVHLLLWPCPLVGKAADLLASLGCNHPRLLRLSPGPRRC